MMVKASTSVACGIHWNVPLYDYNADCDYSNKRPVVKDWAKAMSLRMKKANICSPANTR